MKRQWKAAAVAAAMALGVVGGNALAEATYGYDNSATPGTVSATAKVTINVTTPKLILLRVGGNNATQTQLNFALAPSVPGTPTAPGGNLVWNGAAPTFTANTLAAIPAYAWHNSSGGAALTCTSTGFTTLLPANIKVAATGGTNLLDHPSGNTSCFDTTAGTPASVPLTANTPYAALWTYSVDTAAMTSFPSGSESETVTYTATAL